MFPEISDFDAAFDHNSVLHYVHRDRGNGDLMYSKYDTMLNSLTQIEAVVVAPVPLQGPQLTVGISKILLSFRYRAIGMYSTIDGRYIYLDNDSLSNYMIIGPDNGFMHNSWHNAVHTSADQFLVSWATFESTMGPPDEGVRMRTLGEEMGELTPAFINDTLGDVSSPTQLCYSPVSEVSFLTWSENRSVLYGQMVDVEGALVGESFEVVNDTTLSELFYHKTIYLDSGDFVVFWVESGQPDWHLFSRKYNAQGIPISSKSRIDPDECVFWEFDVTRDSTGNMILIMSGRFPATSSIDIYAYKLDQSAEVVGDIYKITSSEPGQSRVGVKVLLHNDKVYTFWREELELWANISSYSNPPTAIHSMDISTPESFLIHSAYPNPFNPSTTIEYALHEQQTVTLNIFDVNGRIVRTTVNALQAPGLHEMVWNGTDNEGLQVSTGVYFARLQAGEYSSVVKMVYLK